MRRRNGPTEPSRGTLLKKVAEIVDEVTRELDRLLKKGRQTNIERLEKKYSALLDEHILEREQAENLNFIGGTFKMTSAAHVFILKIELYYKDEEGHWVEEKISHPMEIEVLDEASRKTLEEQKELTYEIDPPTPKEPPEEMP